MTFQDHLKVNAVFVIKCLDPNPAEGAYSVPPDCLAVLTDG